MNCKERKEKQKDDKIIKQKNIYYKNKETT